MTAISAKSCSLACFLNHHSASTVIPGYDARILVTSMLKVVSVYFIKDLNYTLRQRYYSVFVILSIFQKTVSHVNNSNSKLTAYLS